MFNLTGEFGIAIHALIFLRHKYPQTISSTQLADNICTNPARIRKIMKYLTLSSLVKVKQGARGGYTVDNPHTCIALSSIANALQEPLITAHWQSGDINKCCYISSGMGKIMNSIYNRMEICCKIHLQDIDISELEKSLQNHTKEKGNQNENL